ncbi:DinB family protein [Maritimibacter sp. DP1N21-5]|uniref:DinB family protein n=1 Tax=Maritimibacter sp. DP1N21-5 TaxID=2836867 RepID=UPI001C44FC44|nr:DinB family protein [Maritimibacter sp. DP1N21-5]MBV7407906.1 DinB family protein [Maritimibacter sp. DP1N21-5]
MSHTDLARRMARYNAWQNDSLIAAADRLSQDARRLDRGAFFGSIEATFLHILWADRMWMSRLAPGQVDAPATRPPANATDDWDRFRQERAEMDGMIEAWAHAMDEAAFAVPLTWYSGIQKRQVTEARSFIVTHVFNHQTHHRGQIHAMLTAAGVIPEDTDLMLMDDPV